jgi:pyridoxine/pyridoxamine 5'-phosphate oxidase
VRTLPWAWVEQRLDAAWNYWLATASPEHGPHARPVWCLWHADGLLFTTSPTSRKARDLAADPRVAVHLEIPGEVVVVDGTVVETEAAPALVDAYVRKYDWRPPETQRWFLIRPVRAYAAEEASYPRRATRFDF